MTIDQQFVEYIIKSLVGDPDAVHIERTVDEKGVLLTLTVAEDDLGRVIGKRGTTAQSIRTLLRALGTKNDARYNLKIVDLNRPERTEEGDTPAPRREEKQEETAQKPVTEQSEKVESEMSELPPVEETTPEVEVDDHNSVVNKTRRELEELDDLDI